MTQVNYPYLDLTVLAEIRTHVIAANAAVLFDRQLEQILWVNGEGANLVGADTVRPVLEGSTTPNPAMMRQITTAVGKLSSNDEASAMMRVSKGFQSQLIGFTVRTIKLPQGEKAVLLLTEKLHGRRHNEQDMARAAVDSLDGYGHASAILDQSGNLIAASEHFNALQVTTKELSALAHEVDTEDDRLIKRLIETQNGKLPTGIARLSDNPALHLLIVADADEYAEEGREALAASDAVIAAVTNTAGSDEAAVVKEGKEEASSVGSFTNRRKDTEKDSSRWYYKSQAQDNDNDEFDDEDTDVVPADNKALPTPKVTIEDTKFESEKRKPKPSVLVQDIEHTSTTRRISDQDLEDVEKALQLDDEELSPEESEHLVQAHSKGNDDFRFQAGSTPIRFVWEMDTDHEFRVVSSEFAQAVGPLAADIKHKTWDEVSKQFGLENGTEISKLLQTRDTWSGKTVLWPIEGTDLRVPIDLAGLPSYGRTRDFEGFNGFGIVRIGDAVVDPNETGLTLGNSLSELETKNRIGFLTGTKPLEETSEQQTEREEARTTPPHEKGGNDNTVVDLDRRRSSSSKRALSSHDQETFEEIAEDLNKRTHFGNKTAEATSPSVAKDKTEVKLDSPQNIRIPKHDVDTSILARLPIPVLVYRDNELLFGNDGFFNLTGYRSLQLLADAGGVDALFGSSKILDTESPAQLFHSDGTNLDVQAHLQRVPWDDDRAMLLTLRAGQNDQDYFKGASVNQTIVEKPKSERLSVSPSIAPDAAPSTTYSPSQQFEAFGGLGAEDLRSILDTATDGIIILSDEGIVRAINRSAEALFDIKPEQIVDRNFTKLLAVESHRSALDYVSNVTGTGVASLLNDGREVIGRTAKGGLVPLFMTIGKLGKTDACCAVVRDITQWKKTEEELVTAKSQAEIASQQKTEFLTKVSHEIRTPLNAIIGFSDIMIEERFGKIENDKYRGYLRDIHRSGNHVLELINDLLDISKIEAGKMDLEFDSCDINAIIAETVALNQPDANKQRVIIRTSLSSAVPKIVADPRSLRQIVLNLVSNSIKYTNSGGQVIVSTVYEESGEVVLRVRDTGIGMSSLELAKALKPFQQIGSTSETGTQGTGLGLPLTKAMVEANRAQFHIESKPEEGTLVEIHFPSQRVLADR